MKLEWPRKQRRRDKRGTLTKPDGEALSQAPKATPNTTALWTRIETTRCRQGRLFFQHNRCPRAPVTGGEEAQNTGKWKQNAAKSKAKLRKKVNPRSEVSRQNSHYTDEQRELRRRKHRGRRRRISGKISPVDCASRGKESRSPLLPLTVD